MSVNKVILGNETVLDLTGDTVAPTTMLTGTTAHGSDGNQIVGIVQPVSVDAATASDTVPVRLDANNRLYTAPVNISIGTVTTGLPGTSASVTNSGSGASPVLNFTIPAGPAGEYIVSTTPLTPGESALESGKVYLLYE